MGWGFWFLDNLMVWFGALSITWLGRKVGRRVGDRKSGVFVP